MSLIVAPGVGIGFPATVSDGFILPGQFSWFPYTLYQKADGTYASTFDFDAAKPSGNSTYYFSPMSGSDTTGNGTEATPYQTLAKALTPSDCGEVICLDDGFIPLSKWGNLPGTPKLKNDTAIHCPSGVAYFLGGEYDVTWTKTDGYTNVYEYANGDIVLVFDNADINGYGKGTKLTLVSDLASVDSTQASFYVDATAGKTYVHTYDDRVPDADVFPAETDAEFTVFGSSTKDVKLWMENINTFNTPTVKFRVNGSTFKLTVYAKNCGSAFSLSASGSGCWSFLGTTSYLKSCSAYLGEYDGFSYHQSAGACKMYEEDCVAFGNGQSGASNDNGSTNHSDGVSGASCIRLNGEYYGSFGPNVADVTAGMSSLNIACNLHDDQSNGNKINFQIDGSGSTGFYIDCTSSDADYDIQATTSAVARYFNSDGSTFTTSGDVTATTSIAACLTGGA